MSENAGSDRVAWDAWWTARRGPDAIRRAQQARLSSLVAYAREHSSFYRELYRDLPPDIHDLAALPTVTKQQLMADFEDWVTDQAVKRADVEAFIADETLSGEYYLGRYSVLRTSGTTGIPALILHDERARAVYKSLYVRGLPGWTYPSALAILGKILRGGIRTAYVRMIGSHTAPDSFLQRALKRDPRLSGRIRLITIARPMADIVAELNSFQPTIMSTIPSAGIVLAREQQASRLKIKPVFVVSTAETLEPALRSEIEDTFGCEVRDLYGAHECLSIAFDCGRGWLHYNADWMVLEPLDENRRPVPCGTTSRTVLLTNLANRIQPFIRYELADSITVRPDPCPCGSPLPAIRVIGRTNEVLSFPARTGGNVSLVPYILLPPLVDTGGVNRSQLIQKSPLKLAVRMEVKPGREDAEVWELATRNMHAVLAEHGILPVEIVRDPQPPTPDPVSGKLRRVWSECSP